ncbi:AGE family epimerase/isomerase [candidate division KSB1 bacterium]|nr:AGE family epimerase/isomerase [candidate division KSB1 bacterium]
MNPVILQEDELEKVLFQSLLDPWYPLSIDKEDGGFLPTFSYDWQPIGNQDKGIVPQARHTWTCSKVALLYPEDNRFKEGAETGYTFLKEALWDSVHGGFYDHVTKEGKCTGGDDTRKLTYGNAFGIYALAAYFELTGDQEVLEFAQDAFHWIEDHAYDPQFGGYFQNLTRDGTPVHLTVSDTKESARASLKDYNSSIHILEAYTALYEVWPDSLLQSRLVNFFILLRDRMITSDGYLMLYFQPDWTPLSFRDSTESTQRKNLFVDHITFGHDIETAYLLYETAHALGMEKDERTLRVIKALTDHAINYGWDQEHGGLFEAGYYFHGQSIPEITNEDKTWWVQAETLNALLLLSHLYPEEDLYHEYFLKQWAYIKEYLIDWEHGGWYTSGLDARPKAKNRPKGHTWKTTYHNVRALMNCIQWLKAEE